MVCTGKEKKDEKPKRKKEESKRRTQDIVCDATGCIAMLVSCRTLSSRKEDDAKGNQTMHAKRNEDASATKGVGREK